MSFNMKFLKIILLFLVATNGSFSQSDFNKLDEKGLKNGVWKGFYEESKRPRYEGTFEHGKEIGTFKFFDDTKAGTVIATREFNKKDNSCYTIFYNQNKNKVSEGKVVNKVYEGEWLYYHEDLPSIMAREFYKKGKLNGKRTVYFKNSKLAEEVNYVNGLKEGAYKHYAENGILLEESNYVKGEFHGDAIFKDPEGNIVAKGKFKNGKKVGMWQFYEQGKLVSEENMSYPKKVKKEKK